ncbi:unnamed protein product, partial [Mesorhabditis spiculigera]
MLPASMHKHDQMFHSRGENRQKGWATRKIEERANTTMTTRSKGGNLFCKGCGLGVSSEENLRVVGLLEHSACHLIKCQFKCGECGHEWRRKREMQRHIRVKHGGRGAIIDQADVEYWEALRDTATSNFPVYADKICKSISKMAGIPMRNKNKANVEASPSAARQGVPVASGVVAAPTDAAETYTPETDDGCLGSGELPDSSKLLKCQACDKTFHGVKTSAEHLLLHTLSHTRLPLFKCTECNYMSSWPLPIETHRNKAHDGRGGKIDLRTPAKYDSLLTVAIQNFPTRADELADHVMALRKWLNERDIKEQASTSKNLKSTPRPTCLRKMGPNPGPLALLNHSLAHSTLEVFGCSRCGFRAPTKASVDEHRQSHHRGTGESSNVATPAVYEDWLATASNDFPGHAHSFGALIDKMKQHRPLPKEEPLSEGDDEECGNDDGTGSQMASPAVHGRKLRQYCTECSHRLGVDPCVEELLQHSLQHSTAILWKCRKCPYKSVLRRSATRHVVGVHRGSAHGIEDRRSEDEFDKLLLVAQANFPHRAAELDEAISGYKGEWALENVGPESTEGSPFNDTAMSSANGSFQARVPKPEPVSDDDEPAPTTQETLQQMADRATTSAQPTTPQQAARLPFCEWQKCRTVLETNSDPAALLRHASHHINFQLWKCSFCPIVSSYRDRLLQHQVKEHGAGGTIMDIGTDEKYAIARGVALKCFPTRADLIDKGIAEMRMHTIKVSTSEPTGQVFKAKKSPPPPQRLPVKVKAEPVDIDEAPEQPPPKKLRLPQKAEAEDSDGDDASSKFKPSVWISQADAERDFEEEEALGLNPFALAQPNPEEGQTANDQAMQLLVEAKDKQIAELQRRCNSKNITIRHLFKEMRTLQKASDEKARALEWENEELKRRLDETENADQVHADMKKAKEELADMLAKKNEIIRKSNAKIGALYGQNLTLRQWLNNEELCKELPEIPE